MSAESAIFRDSSSLFPAGFSWFVPRDTDWLSGPEYGRFKRAMEALFALHSAAEIMELSTITQCFRWWMIKGAPRATRPRRILTNVGLKEAIRFHFIYATKGISGLAHYAMEGRL